MDRREFLRLSGLTAAGVAAGNMKWVNDEWLRQQLLQAGAAQASTEAKAAAHHFVPRPPGESLTEYLLTSPQGFNLTTATPAQRAACRIADGVPLGDLADHPDVLELVGGEHALDALPSEAGHKALEVALVAAIRGAKTMFACAAGLRMAMTVDLSGLGAGETARVSLLSVKLDNADVAFRMWIETIRQSPMLRPLLVGEPVGDSFWIAHPSGKPIEVAVVAGARAGAGLVSRWSAGAIFDEAPRMNGATEAVVNLDHARSAVIGRLLPGAQAIYIGSPWAEQGPVYEMVEEGWEQPSRDRVVLRGTGPMLNPIWWTPERCALLQDSDPAAYETDVLARFGGTAGGLFSSEAIKRNTRETTGDLPFEPRGGEYFAAMDPSDGTAKSNPWTLVVVQRKRRPMPMHTPDGEPVMNRDGTQQVQLANTFRVVACREWQGVEPDEAVKESAQVCKAYGLRSAVTDQYAGKALAALARQHSFELRVVPWTRPRKLQVFTDVATLIESDAVELDGNPALLRDLRSVRKEKTQEGFRIVFPKMGDGRHCDYAPALASAIEQGNKAPIVVGVYSGVRAHRAGMPRPRE